jgi:hypothetical protein
MSDDSLIFLGDFPVSDAKNIAEKLDSLHIPFMMEQNHSIESLPRRGSFGTKILMSIYVHQNDVELVTPIVQSVTKILM